MAFRWPRQNALSTAVSGEIVSTMFEGRERYPINVRYMRDFRSDLGSLGKVLIAAVDKQIPLSQLATMRTLNGPAVIRDENGLRTGYVFVDVANRPFGDYINDAREVLAKQLQLPAGYTLLWSGQYESSQRVREHLYLVIPITFALILFLRFANTRSAIKTMIVILAIPFSVVGALWAFMRWTTT